MSKRKDNVKLDIYTSKNAKLTNTEIDKFNKQYGNLNKNYIKTFHDRFFILHEKLCYHIGISIKKAYPSTKGYAFILHIIITKPCDIKHLSKKILLEQLTPDK